MKATGSNCPFRLREGGGFVSFVLEKKEALVLCENSNCKEKGEDIILQGERSNRRKVAEARREM